MATSKTPENGSKKPAAKKATATKEIASKAPAKKTASKTTASGSKKSGTSSIVTSQNRLQMIETAAYYIAEKHGFSGPSTDHWLAAEKQIDSQLNA